ncbi:MAG: MerR family transcriptional regulator, repressor of the yfmOP operon [Ilumatobacteraceae bacterium]|jgi:DNA-binding transcriptional MerR regulator
MNEIARPIGKVAEQVGVTTRTLRYYEEVGLVTPSSHSAGGSRRYTEADVARVLRIRELQAVMGFNLDEIRELLHAGDRMESLRAEYRAGTSPERTAEIVNEAARLNARTQEQVLAKIGLLQAYLAELQTEAKKYQTFADEHGTKLIPHS